MTHITITGRSGSNDNLAAVLRGYVERFELTSPMVKQMMLDAADEIERLQKLVNLRTVAEAWGKPEIERLGQLVHDAGLVKMADQTEIERLRAQKAKLICDGCRRLGEVADDNERLTDENKRYATAHKQLQAELDRRLNLTPASRDS